MAKEPNQGVGGPADPTDEDIRIFEAKNKAMPEGLKKEIQDPTSGLGEALKKLRVPPPTATPPDHQQGQGR